LLSRQHVPITYEYVSQDDSCTNGEDLCQLLIAFEQVIEEALTLGMYDVCGRTCMVLSGLLDELAASRRGVPDSAKEILQLILGSLQLEDGNKVDLESATAESLGSLMEQAAREMTKKCVCTLTGILAHSSCLPVFDQWVIAVAPVRIDLAGGWSDTPPVCVEYGSTVTGMAVVMDGKLPLSCRARCSSGQGIVLRSELRDIKSGELQTHSEVTLSSFNDLRDYQDPQSDGALLKCALVCLGLTTREQIQQMNEDENSFQRAINSFCMSGDNIRMEVVVTSLLPQGSGLGTSSILGGCVLAAIGQCVGRDFLRDREKDDSGKPYPAKLIDGVLVLEQQLTTGGGFQDQVNGLIGGVKSVRCKPFSDPPLRLSVEQMDLDPAFRSQLNSRVILAFTGKTRLAKNILRNVLNRWSKRTPEIVETVRELVRGAETANEAIKAGDLESLAACFDEYWQLKKRMAGPDSGVEPEYIRQIISELKSKDMIAGASLCGAGGGGFLAFITKADVSKDELCSAIEDADGSLTWHDCELSDEGVSTFVLPNQGSSHDRNYFDMEWHCYGTSKQ
jgi:fucokinase